MADDRAFFQIAAALLPALMFGGLLSDRLRPPARTARGYELLSRSCSLGGVCLLYAEAIAIRVAITGAPSTFERIVVVLAVMGASALALFMLLVPWVKQIPRPRRNHWASVIVGLSVTAAGTVLALDNAVKFSTGQEQLAKRQEERAALQRTGSRTDSSDAGIGRARRPDKREEERDLPGSRAARCPAPARAAPPSGHDSNSSSNSLRATSRSSRPPRTCSGSGSVPFSMR